MSIDNMPNVQILVLIKSKERITANDLIESEISDIIKKLNENRDDHPIVARFKTKHHLREVNLPLFEKFREDLYSFKKMPIILDHKLSGLTLIDGNLLLSFRESDLREDKDTKEERRLDIVSAWAKERSFYEGYSISKTDELCYSVRSLNISIKYLMHIKGYYSLVNLGEFFAPAIELLLDNYFNFHNFDSIVSGDTMGYVFRK